jgi:flavin reductase (DIM6/NTAB) family NADH-FMN oxidoreductase RutF
MSDQKQEFRKALGRFASGITVITVAKEDGVGIHGMTANSFTSVSLVPPQILVCVGDKARALELLHAAGRFGVTVLREDQQPLSDYFAYGQQDPAEGERIGVRFRRSERDTPLLEGGLATLDCKVVGAHVSGDHTVFIGEVEEMSWTEGNPLLYFEGQYRKLRQYYNP